MTTSEDSHDPGPLLPGLPACLLCAVRRDDGSPIPHEHLDGRTPHTSCEKCWQMRHDECQPDPFWCICSHPLCLLRGNP